MSKEVVQALCKDPRIHEYQLQLFYGKKVEYMLKIILTDGRVFRKRTRITEEMLIQDDQWVVLDLIAMRMLREIRERIFEEDMKP